MRITRWASSLALATMLAAGPGQAAVTLVQGGQPKAELVYAKGNPAAGTAAKELAAFILQSTGAKLKATEAPTPGVAHVFLGASGESAKAGVTPGDLGPEGFHLKTVGNDVHIVGDDSPGDPIKISRNFPARTGTLSGAYELLERVAGVRFFWHDALGTIVPQHTDLVVSELNLTQAPRWRYRSLPYAPEGQTFDLFGRRLRLGQAYGMSHSHAWFRILPVEKYGKEHPEYYALVKGERQNRYYLDDHGGQVCTSNPAVVEIFAQAAIDFYTQNPNASMFSISPNDGGGFCQCERCRALDVETWGDEEQGHPVLTDRMLTFYNQIAEKVAAKFPDKYLGAYVYSYYRKPPVHTRPHPNLALVWAVNSAGLQGQGWERERQWLDQWTALTPNFYSYDIYWLSEWCLGLPAPMTGFGVEKLKHLLSTPMLGGYLYAAPSYESLGALPYVMARLMWDPSADAAALEKDYYDGLYGPAGADVKAWYDLLEGRLRKLRNTGLDTQDPALLAIAEGSRANAALTVNAYAPILAEADAILKRAQAKPLDDAQKQRLGRLMDHATLLRTTVTAYLGAEHLTRQAAWDATEVDATRKAIEERAAVIERLRAYAPTLAKILDESDRTDTAQCTPSAAAYQLARRSGPTVVYAAPAAQAPAVDAKLSDAWAPAAWRDLLDTRSGGAPRGPARAALMTTGTDLYLFVEGRDEDPAKLYRRATARGDLHLFEDDGVELFLVPPGGGRYYHLALGAGGALYTKLHPTGKAEETADWSPAVESAVSVGEHGWNAELKLPLAALQPAPKPGDAGWKVDVFRVRRGSAGTSEYTALSPTFGGHHQPEKFAELRFAAPAQTCGFAHGDLEGLTPERFTKEFKPSITEQATIELAGDHAYAGANTVHVKVEGTKSLAQLNLTSKVQAGKSYRITFVHRQQVTGKNAEVRAEAPITRVICRDADGKNVTPTSGYNWSGVPMGLMPGQWRTYAHTFTAAPGSAQITFSVFLFHPGEYRLDNFRIEAIE